jgi:hypothetical protein
MTVRKLQLQLGRKMSLLEEITQAKDSSSLWRLMKNQGIWVFIKASMRIENALTTPVDAHIEQEYKDRVELKKEGRSPVLS